MKITIWVACLKPVPWLDQESLFVISAPVVSAELKLELGAAVEPAFPVVERAGAEVPVESEKTEEDFLT